jgi:DNA-binding transcriptional ArsR family regulator
MGEIRLTLSPGRPKDEEIREALARAVQETRVANIEQLRRAVSEELGREVSWRTVNRHLADLEVLGLAKRHVLARFRAKSTVLVTAPADELR